MAASDQLAEVDTAAADPGNLATHARRALLLAQIRDLLKGRQNQLRLADLDAERKARVPAEPKADAHLDAREAARLEAAALDFLATIKKITTDTDSITSAIPAESELVRPASQEPASQNPGLQLRWFPAADEPDITARDFTDQSNWTAEQVKSSTTTRVLAIQLSHRTHRVEINIRRLIDSILLDGKAVVRLPDITCRTHTFGIPDGQTSRKAEVWVTSDFRRRIDGVRLTVDGRLLYQE